MRWNCSATGWRPTSGRPGRTTPSGGSCRGQADALLEAFYRRHSRNKALIHTVNDLLDACWFQAAMNSRQALLLGLQMGAAVAGAGPLRWEP